MLQNIAAVGAIILVTLLWLSTMLYALRHA